MCVSDDSVCGCMCGCVWFCAHKPVSSAVHLLWCAHLIAIMKATFDFNLSWNPLLLSQVTLPLILLSFSCFFSSRSHCHKNHRNSRATVVQKWHFSKVGQSLGKVTQGLDYNTPFCSDCVFIALNFHFESNLNPIMLSSPGHDSSAHTLNEILILKITSMNRNITVICGCLHLLRGGFTNRKTFIN